MSTIVHAVVGATGQQGGATVRHLLAGGGTVRALVRDPASEGAQRLRSAGAETVAADLTDSASLQQAFTGADRVWLMTTSFTERGTDGETADGVRAVDAAVAAGVGHLVHSSVGGADRGTGIPHFESKRRIEEHLLTSGLPATIVRPVFFMENLPGSLDREAGVLRLPMPGEVPLQLIAVDDIGAACAVVLRDPGRVPGGAVEIAGDELTGEQMAQVLGVRFEEVPRDGLDEDMRAMFTWFATSSPAYDADRDLTRALVPDVADLRTWAARERA